ncbi:MAG: hypothetical protein JO001_15955 [Alphaproteobacteria bacterium]|nr:hypothetical protein [Alphaproteobacteria bacterium]
MVIQLTSRSILNVLFRHRRLFSATMGLTVALATLYCATATRIYRSEAALVIKFAKQDRANGPDVAIAAQTTERREVINTNIRLLTSVDLLSKLVGDAELLTIYPELSGYPGGASARRERAIDQLMHDVKVTAGRDSDVIELSLDNPNAEVAASTLSRLIRLFVDRQTQLYRGLQSTLVEQQTTDARQRLDQSQRNLDDFIKTFGISSYDDERSALLKLEMDTRAALGQQQSKLGEALGRRDAAKTMLGSLKPEIPLSNENDRYHAVDDARTRLADLTARSAELRNYQPNSPTAQAMETQISSARAELAAAARLPEARLRTGPNPVYQQVQGDLNHTEQDIKGAQGAISPLETQLQQIDDRLRALNTHQGEFHALTLQRETDEESYRTFLQRADDARVVDALNNQNVTAAAMLQAPTIPERPALPRVPLILGLSLLIGVLLGGGGSFAAELLDQTFSLPDQLEPALGLPVLASIRRV